MNTLHGSDVVTVTLGTRELNFDPVAHAYHLDGQPVKGVTTYLKEAGYCHPWHGDGSAALMGRYKHEATAYDDAGDLAEDLDPALLQAVELWRQFKQEHDFVPDLTLMERPCFHAIYQYAGMPDVPGTWHGGKRVVIEKKFGQPEKWHVLQVGGGYAPMLASQFPQYQGAESALVYMPSDAKIPKVVPVTDKCLPALFAAITATVNGRYIYGANNGT